ncbi:MAG: hypothetical protein MUF87_04145 [Anaerolineae bacterium]|jgi:hypothetical protein|nr:hypothetical protein [Anaerolineae bacterium]
MQKKHLFALLELFMLLVVFVPLSYAQSDVDTQALLNALAPRNEMPYLLIDILLYAIFILGMITMFLVPDKQLLPGLLMVAVVGTSVISKIAVSEPRTIFSPCDLPVLGINTFMFVIPLIVAGMVRARGKTPAALAPGILTGLVGGGHFFLFWALLQRGCASTQAL